MIISHVLKFVVLPGRGESISSGKVYELAEVVRDLNKGDDIMVDQSLKKG